MWIWPAIILSLLPLQGCLLDYFFAPKIAAGELPSDPAMESLRSSYITQCGRCHLLVSPNYFTRERPIDAFTDRYLAARLITRREADEVATFIRTLNAMPQASPMPKPTPLATPPMPEPEDSESPEASDLPEISPEPEAGASPRPRPSDTPAPSPTTDFSLPIEIPPDGPVGSAIPTQEP